MKIVFYSVGLVCKKTMEVESEFPGVGAQPEPEPELLEIEPDSGEKEKKKKKQPISKQEKMKKDIEKCNAYIESLKSSKKAQTPSKTMKITELKQISELLNHPQQSLKCKAAYILPLMEFLKKVKLEYTGCFEAGNGDSYIYCQEGQDFVDKLKTELSPLVYAKCRYILGRSWWKISRSDFPKAQNALYAKDTKYPEEVKNKAYIILTGYNIIDFQNPKPGEERRCIIPYFRYEPIFLEPKPTEPLKEENVSSPDELNESVDEDKPKPKKRKRVISKKK